MSDIEKKLESARSKAKDYGRLYGQQASSDDRLKGTYAILYADSKGTVAERDSWVKRQESYKQAVIDKGNAYAEWKEAEIWMKLLMLEAECWRTEQANNRYMDQAHR